MSYGREPMKRLYTDKQPMEVVHAQLDPDRTHIALSQQALIMWAYFVTLIGGPKQYYILLGVLQMGVFRHCLETLYHIVKLSKIYRALCYKVYWYFIVIGV